MIAAIDTSSPLVSVALGTESGGPFIERSGASVNSHDEELAEIFLDVCKSARVAPSALELLLVGSGPGSFTGLRIGYAFTKGLALALNLRLAGISTFRAAAYAAAGEGLVVVLSDARREELFFAVYERTKDGGVRELFAPAIVAAADREVLSARIAKDAGLASAPALRVDLGVAPGISLAGGLLKAWFAERNTIPVAAGPGLAVLEPFYLRAVAAKTIAERAR